MVLPSRLVVAVVVLCPSARAVVRAVVVVVRFVSVRPVVTRRHRCRPMFIHPSRCRRPLFVRPSRRRPPSRPSVLRPSSISAGAK